MKISDWNEDNNGFYNVMFDITDSSNCLLCAMTVQDLLNMADELKQIIKTIKWEDVLK
jgi:CRISPR/Cas system-associated protein Csm6